MGQLIGPDDRWTDPYGIECTQRGEGTDCLQMHVEPPYDYRGLPGAYGIRERGSGRAYGGNWALYVFIILDSVCDPTAVVVGSQHDGPALVAACEPDETFAELERWRRIETAVYTAHVATPFDPDAVALLTGDIGDAFLTHALLAHSIFPVHRGGGFYGLSGPLFATPGHTYRTTGDLWPIDRALLTDDLRTNEGMAR
jgi:hypothetical protein